MTYLSSHARSHKVAVSTCRRRRRPRLRSPEWAWSYEEVERYADGRPFPDDAPPFVMDYTNLQVQTPIGIGVLDMTNATAATIRGVEVENTSRIGRGVEAGGHMTWLDATYNQYVAVSEQGVTGDVAGNRLNNAPEWAGRVLDRMDR